MAKFVSIQYFKRTALLGLCLIGTVVATAQPNRSTDGRKVTEAAPATSATIKDSAADATTPATSDDATAKVPERAKRPVVLSFNHLPGKDWTHTACGTTSSAVVSHGLLTINSPDQDCNEYDLFYPKGIWNQYVSNQRGWIVETSLKVDPSTQPECSSRGSVQLWINDLTNLIIVGISNNAICIAYPDVVAVDTPTTDGFHIYRVESKGKVVRIYQDGQLKIEHTLTTPGGGTESLGFGDGDGEFATLSTWDYLSYDVFPHFNPADWPQ
jgi:hypothetical protein